MPLKRQDPAGLRLRLTHVPIRLPFVRKALIEYGSRTSNRMLVLRASHHPYLVTASSEWLDILHRP